MTEISLQYLSMDELYALMVKTIDEYLVLHKHPGNKNELEIKRAELSLIQQVITTKKAKTRQQVTAIDSPATQD